jgi:hypothetical protein
MGTGRCQTAGPPRHSKRRRIVAAVSAVTLVASLSALFVPSLASAAPPPAGTWGGYVIDGVLVPDVSAGMVTFDDPSGAVKELGPVGGLKLNELHEARATTLTDQATSDKSDLLNVWLDVNQDAAGVAWLYLGWERVSKNGSVTVIHEFQKNGQPASCKPGPSFEASCNPWVGRQVGDFVIVFDYQGGVSKVWKRDFEADGAGLKLNTGVLLNTPVPLPGQPVGKAATSVGELRGEAAVNLTATVFPAVPTDCSSFANVIPYTVTGNSDTAAPEDVVLGDTSKAAISNCGKVSIRKQTTPTAGVVQDFSVTLSRPGVVPQPVRYPAALTTSATINASDATATVVADLRPGEDYTLTEADVPGWEKVSIVCDGVTVWANGAATGTPFAVRVDDTTACTVVNKQIVREIKSSRAPRWPA